MKTMIINLWASPSCGKSTLAAGLFSHLKHQGVSCELVTEVAKEYAWEGRAIGPLDQYRITLEQFLREERLLGQVDYVITDSPARLGLFYAEAHRHPSRWPLEAFFQAAHDARFLAGHRSAHLLLPRRERYDVAGRYQTKEEAVQLHQTLEDWLRARTIGVTRLPDATLLSTLEALRADGVLPSEAA